MGSTSRRFDRTEDFFSGNAALEQWARRKLESGEALPPPGGCVTRAREKNVLMNLKLGSRAGKKPNGEAARAGWAVSAPVDRGGS